MQIEKFDMSSPFANGDPRISDVLEISKLWHQIDEKNTNGVVGDPEFLRVIMDGLDYYVMRPEPIASLIGAISIMNCGRGLAKIDSLAVHPDRQRLGYGRALAERAIQHCEETGTDAITVVAMPSSYKIFASLGFKPDFALKSGNTTMSLDL